MNFPKLTLNDCEYLAGLATVIMWYLAYKCSGVSTTPETSNVELSVLLVNDFQPLTNVTKNSRLDALWVLDTSLTCENITI